MSIFKSVSGNRKREDQTVEDLPTDMLRGLKEKAGVNERANVIVKESWKRSLYKDLIYRVTTSAMVTPIVSYAVTRQWKYAAAISAVEMVTKLPGYFAFDRLFLYYGTKIFERFNIDIGYKIIKDTDTVHLERGEKIVKDLPEPLVMALKQKAGLSENDKVKVIETKKRSLVKTLTYRAWASYLETPIIAKIVTGKWKTAAFLGGLESIVKIGWYFGFEQFWSHKIPYGYTIVPASGAKDTISTTPQPIATASAVESNSGRIGAEKAKTILRGSFGGSGM
jgi:uncharacterized membrane protein